MITLKKRITISLKNTEDIKRTETMKQLKQIRKFYTDLSKEVNKKIKQMGGEDLQRYNLILLQRDITNRLNDIQEQITSGIQNSMLNVTRYVKDDTIQFLESLGFKAKDLGNAFAYVPDMIVRNIVNGNIYKQYGGGEWQLSTAIWGDNQRTISDIYRIVAEGTAQGKNAYDVAKDLEKYVNPTVRKDWNWSKVYPGTKKVVDYSAQRLARTMITHAYQQAFEEMHRDDPFITEYIWRISNNHDRVCDICKARNGRHYRKGRVPLDHPNGMCTLEPYIPYTSKQIGDRIADWYNSPTGSDPDLDRYAQRFVQ